MFWKLSALQTFISDLQWPEEEFNGHLEKRMKSMAADMISQCVTKFVTQIIIIFNFYVKSCIFLIRTVMCFEQFLNKAKKTTDYILPTEICVMINVIFDAKNQVNILYCKQTATKTSFHICNFSRNFVLHVLFVEIVEV